MRLKLALEWLNRVWKDTQLDLLVEKFVSEWLNLLYMRWSWSRSWEWTKTFQNPKSKYRQLLQRKAYEEPINTEKSDKLRLKATWKLQREIVYALETQDPDILLLNRNIVTNHFMHKQENKEITLDETIERIYNASRWIGPTFADQTIILHTHNLDLFLDRAKRTDDKWFRRNLLLKHFSLYDMVLNDLVKSNFQYTIIDADQDIQSIHNQILYEIERVRHKESQLSEG